MADLDKDQLQELANLLTIAINLKKERALQIIDEMVEIREEDKTYAVKNDETFLGFKYTKTVRPSDYTLATDEKWGENILGSDVSIKNPLSSGTTLDGNLVVLVPEKRFVRKKTKERIATFEKKVWDKIEDLIKKEVGDGDIK